MPEEIERFPDLEDIGSGPAVCLDPVRMNPRYLLIDPESAGREFYADLLMEQQEQF